MIEMQDKIHFIITGGTIDSHYDGSKDTVVPNKRSVIPDFLKSVRVENVVFSEVCIKDSRKLNDKDRSRILNIIEKSNYNKFIITHGTYTMSDTARYLKHKIKSDKTVVITGSLMPIAGFSFSDGPFNLGYSIARVKELKSGVYVCIHGKTFSPEEVAKDMGKGTFFSLFR